MNRKALRTLEYDKIIAELKTHLASTVGAECADALSPTSALADANVLLTQTAEAEGIYTRTGGSPIDAFPDIRTLLSKLHAALFITAGELLQIAAVLKVAREARNALQAGDANGLLCNMANQLASHRSVEEEIARCILAEDEIADNASPELARILRQIKIVSERVREKINQYIKGASTQKYLQEPLVTVRNGRYVIPVKAEHRAQVPGLIHDQSSSGATLYIEPAAVVELGNEHKRLLIEENAEIERILSGLTAMVAPYADELHNSIVLLGELDLIFARAIMARDHRSVQPKLNAIGHIRILRGRHPLLHREAVVPIDVWLGDTFTTLIITGPNTGGKTVTLKTIGLFSLMAMSGMFVPADEGTELSVFDQVFADIGDEQSIEQSLSTFSSHMTNTVSILQNANAHSLVLLDELGAGTDPVEGAALAQAILETLYERNALTVATTHYSEIKAFALLHSGMQNASMEFDVDRLCPTYRLFIGIPGKSNAFEISRRLGLEADVIDRAETFLEKKDIAFENVLSEAEEARKAAEKLRDEAYRANIEAQSIRTELERAKRKLEDEKAQLRSKAREEARLAVTQTRHEMEQLIAELRATRNIDGKVLERAVQTARDRMRKSEETLYEQAMHRDAAGDAPKSVQVGERVMLLKLGKEATVIKAENGRGEVVVQAGVIKMNVPLSDIRAIAKKKEKAATSSRVQLSAERGEVMQIDLRGKMVDEACMEIDRFIDDTTFTGVSEFNIIHGKGTGALRSGIQTFLRTHPKVKTFRMGAYGEGDAGVTVVTLK